jgi:transcriptional regulator of arginine metabolism
VKKKERQGAIAKLLAREAFPDQAALGRNLHKLGHRVSQASLSRDLREMGVQRLRQADGTYAYAMPLAPPAAGTPNAFAKRFATSAIGVRRSGPLVLVFTPPGEAGLVGRLLDEAHLPGVVGTLAGDDTILCVAASPKAARTMENKLKEMIR